MLVFMIFASLHCLLQEMQKKLLLVSILIFFIYNHSGPAAKFNVFT